MTFWTQLKLGVKTYGVSFQYIFRKGLWWILLFPLGINILLFLGGNALIGEGIDALKDVFLTWTKLDNTTFWGSEFLGNALQIVVSLMVRFLFFILFAYFGGYIVLIILSPILAYLSEKTEKIHTGNDYPFNMKQFLIDIGRGIAIALRNLMFELVITAFILLFTLVPIIGWLIGMMSPVILFFVSSYFYGFSYLDYALERKKINIANSVKLMRKYKGIVMANGSIFAISLLIPFCGASISSFMALFSVIAGTIAMDTVLNDEKVTHVEN